MKMEAIPYIEEMLIPLPNAYPSPPLKIIIVLVTILTSTI
jgi:hypothetical protein